MNRDKKRLEIIVNPGELPVFWDKSVVFVVNLHALFFGNDELTKVLEGEIRGIPTYGGRVISVLDLIFRGKNNLVLMETPPDKSLVDYVKNSLGVSIPDMEILSYECYQSLKNRFKNHALEDMERIFEKVRSHSADWIDGYVTDETLRTIAENTGKSTISSIEGSKNGNNKLLLYKYLLEKGLPVFDTALASSPGEVISSFQKLCKKGYREAVLKSQIGASGCGLAKHYTACNPTDELPDYFFFEGVCLVQGWLNDNVAGVKKIGSPSVQMFLSEDRLSLYDITEQFLSAESVHEGNFSPPPYFKDRPDIKDEILSQSAVAGSWLHEQGYRGTAGIDFLIVERNGKTEVIINEINARITGATYPAVLARHFLPHGAWLMRNLRFDPSLQSSHLLSKVDGGGILFNKDMNSGVLPFNFNLDDAGNVHKGQFLFIAPEIEECFNLLNEIQSLFPSVCKFDRD